MDLTAASDKPNRASAKTNEARRPAKNSLTWQVAEHLRVLIQREGLIEGDELPSQGEFAEALGVSRIVVREATKVLEAQGLVRAEQGRRLTVSRPNALQFGSLFSLIVQNDESALLELLDVRSALEFHLARLAAEHATLADIEFMKNAADDLCNIAKGALEKQAEADGLFHRGIALASRNRFMMMLLDALGPPLHELRIRSLKGTWARLHTLDEVAAGHEAILTRIAARDPDGAAIAMAAHLSHTFTDLQVAKHRRR